MLVVEDQEAVRELTKTVLEAYGYHVFEATNGDEALAFVKQHPDEIHLLLTDVILPGMNGKDLSERLRRLRPKLKVLFTSGIHRGGGRPPRSNRAGRGIPAKTGQSGGLGG